MKKMVAVMKNRDASAKQPQEGGELLSDKFFTSNGTFEGQGSKEAELTNVCLIKQQDSLMCTIEEGKVEQLSQSQLVVRSGAESPF